MSANRDFLSVGEDLTRFRNKSQELFTFLSTFTWSGRCERLGLDEVFLDVTEVISENLCHVDPLSPGDSFFRLSKHDHSLGFTYDASSFADSTLPRENIVSAITNKPDDELNVRLALGSHLAQYIRQLLVQEKGFTAAVGISTNKLLSKLVGNVNKPDGQTTLIPPYQDSSTHGMSNVLRFLDPLEIGKIPGIGFKVSQSIKRVFLGREPSYNEGLVVGRSHDFVSVASVRHAFTLGKLEETLGSRLGRGVFDWIHGRDTSEVLRRRYPTQISFEDTYLDLRTLEQARDELLRLAKRLIARMRLDLSESDAYANQPSIELPRSDQEPLPFRYAATPHTVRLSTRRRRPAGERSFQRISRSLPMPSFVLSAGAVDVLAVRLVDECLLPLFKRAHGGDPDWNLNLINVAATDISDEGSKSLNVAGMMLRKGTNTVPGPHEPSRSMDVPDRLCAEFNCVRDDTDIVLRDPSLDTWDDESPSSDKSYDNAVQCQLCDASFPVWASAAHQRYHEEESTEQSREQNVEAG